MLFMFVIQEAMLEERDHKLAEADEKHIQQEQQLIAQHMKIDELQKAMTVNILVWIYVYWCETWLSLYVYIFELLKQT